jgi:hypothetical protein
MQPMLRDSVSQLTLRNFFERRRGEPLRDNPVYHVGIDPGRIGN